LTFFNQVASEYIQFISMFLEMTGITLAYIEIRYKPLATRIEMRILVEENRIKDFGYNLLQNKLFSALITVFVMVVFFIEIPYLAGFFDSIVPAEWNDVKVAVIWLTLPIIVLFALSICFLLFADFVSWLNYFSNGHAIGALGVVVTFLGLLGETYQVITILLDD
jgi:hypothetical protein